MITNQQPLSKEVTIHENTSIVKGTFEDYVEIGPLNAIENASFGSFSYTGQFCFVQNAKIGKFANIAACVRIGPTDHPYQRPTLHHFTYRPSMYGFGIENEAEIFEKREARITTVGHDTWIGHGAIIRPEVSIGNGAIVGAGAVVTKDIPPYAIAVGVPAKVIKYRFDPATIEKLEKLKWWDWPFETLKERYQDFRLPIDEFLAKYYKEEDDK
ncbi:MAG: chloramphenicol acetyltransferase [Bacillota bacterium]|nr:chloramphenicol acetyltransferase [Bacillota bacterium]